MLATLPRGGCLVPMSTTSATVAELTAATDAISAYRQRVANLALPHVGKERDDLVTAIYEAERALRVAERTLQRALRLAEA
jgi:hypothetical protein